MTAANLCREAVQVISRRVVGRAEETPASEVGGKSVTTLPPWPLPPPLTSAWAFTGRMPKWFE